jgi:hypothetical protein
MRALTLTTNVACACTSLAASAAPNTRTSRAVIEADTCIASSLEPRAVQSGHRLRGVGASEKVARGSSRQYGTKGLAGGNARKAFVLPRLRNGRHRNREPRRTSADAAPASVLLGVPLSIKLVDRGLEDNASGARKTAVENYFGAGVLRSGARRRRIKWTRPRATVRRFASCLKFIVATPGTRRDRAQSPPARSLQLPYRCCS